MADDNPPNNRHLQAVEHDDIYENRPVKEENENGMFIVDGLRHYYQNNGAGHHQENIVIEGNNLSLPDSIQYIILIGLICFILSLLIGVMLTSGNTVC